MKVQTDRELLEVLEILPQDCAYGWRASALMSDGSIRYGTSKLHPTSEEAIAEVRAAIARAAAALTQGA